MKRIQRVGAIPQGHAALHAEAIDFDKKTIEASIKLGEVVIEEIMSDSGNETPVEK